MSDRADCEAKIASQQQTIEYLEAQLAASQKEIARIQSVKREFGVLVSHELRTPVAIIKECISQLQDGLFGNVTDEQEKLLALAMVNIDRLTGSINQYIERSREESEGTRDFEQGGRHEKENFGD